MSYARGVSRLGGMGGLINREVASKGQICGRNLRAGRSRRGLQTVLIQPPAQRLKLLGEGCDVGITEAAKHLV